MTLSLLSNDIISPSVLLLFIFKIMGLKKSANTLKRVLKWALYLPVYCSLGKNADLLLAAPFQITAKPKKILFLDTTALCKFCWILFSKNIVFFHRSFDDACFIITSQLFVWKITFFIQTGNQNNSKWYLN